MSRKRHFLSNAYEYFNTLTLVFYLMVSIPLIFFVLLYLHFEEQGGLKTTEHMQILPHILIPLGIIASIYFAYYIYKQKLHEHQPVKFQEKLRMFHELALYKYSFISIANFLAVLGLYLTGEQLFAGLYAIALVVFSLNRPTHKRICTDMKLNEEEEQWLRSDKNFDEL